ncbi:MAG: hypothetical protein KC486_22190 [Myxococcales bacterium]|nr:hypothetical protein [Myxococcales bacterium]
MSSPPTSLAEFREVIREIASGGVVIDALGLMKWLALVDAASPLADRLIGGSAAERARGR